MNSKYVCQRCGLSVQEWGNGWKHSGNGSSYSCGRVPHLILRTEYEEQIAGMLKSAQNAFPSSRARLEMFNNRQDSFSSKRKRNSNE